MTDGKDAQEQKYFHYRMKKFCVDWCEVENELTRKKLTQPSQKV
jgi:hypothetical protein